VVNLGCSDSSRMARLLIDLDDVGSKANFLHHRRSRRTPCLYAGWEGSDLSKACHEC
jgi:hypothetical protein